MADILLTGASSFSGMWIAEGLAAAGHRVIAPLKRARADYDHIRLERVIRLAEFADVIFDAPFASPRFLSLIASERPELLAHHAADIPTYCAADYDVGAGVARNLQGAQQVLQALARHGGATMIATGTTFERGEGGAGADDLAVSPYGLSKTLTNEALRHLARWQGLGFGRFVVAAPFGALEEGRFAWSLFQHWFAGRPGVVRTPRYVRDNIPAPRLGHAYGRLVDALAAEPGGERTERPQGFVGTQEAFARRLASEMAPRLNLDCEVEVLAQPVLAEPEVRINSEPALQGPWDEPGFWDEYAAYYRHIARTGALTAPA